MKMRFIAPLAALLCLLFIAAEPGQMVGKVKLSEGPTPFISFVQTQVSDVAPFRFAQFQIQPKIGSATRPIKARYARAYLEARGYFDPQNGNLTIPVFGLYAGRENKIEIDLGFSDRFDYKKVFGVKITTPAYNGGTYSNPTVIQPLLPGTTLSYDFILLKAFTDPITPIIIDTEAEVRWVGTAEVGVRNCMLFDNAFYLGSGTRFFALSLMGDDKCGQLWHIGVTGFHHNIDPGREGMILDVDTVH